MTEILLMLVGLEGLIIFVLSYFYCQERKTSALRLEMLHREQLVKAKYHRELEATNPKAPLLVAAYDQFQLPEYTMKVDEVV